MTRTSGGTGTESKPAIEAEGRVVIPLRPLTKLVNLDVKDFPKAAAQAAPLRTEHISMVLWPRFQSFTPSRGRSHCLVGIRLVSPRSSECVHSVRGKGLPGRHNLQGASQRECRLDIKSDFIGHFSYSIHEGTYPPSKDTGTPNSQNYRPRVETRSTKNFQSVNATRND